MTEQDWADQAQAEDCLREDDVRISTYKETLLVWSDWCEDEGLDYHKGLRMLANLQDGIPRRPCKNSPFGSSWQRGQKFFHWSNNYSVMGVTLHVLPSRVLSRLKMCPVKYERRASRHWSKDPRLEIISYHYDSYLDAMKAASLACQRAHSVGKEVK